MMPGLGEKYEIKIETISKPKTEFITDEYFELELPVAPAVMVGDEIVVEGSDIGQFEVETEICKQLDLPPPKPENKGFLKKIFRA
jgi:hypothetical protein